MGGTHLSTIVTSRSRGTTVSNWAIRTRSTTLTRETSVALKGEEDVSGEDIISAEDEQNVVWKDQNQRLTLDPGAPWGPTSPGAPWGMRRKGIKWSSILICYVEVKLPDEATVNCGPYLLTRLASLTSSTLGSRKTLHKMVMVTKMKCFSEPDSMCETAMKPTWNPADPAGPCSPFSPAGPCMEKNTAVHGKSFHMK